MSLFFHPLFKGLSDRSIKVKVHLKNGTQVSGSLQHVDANLNMQLSEVSSSAVQLTGVSRCFVRGSSVKFVSVSHENLHPDLLQEIISKEAQQV